MKIESTMPREWADKLRSLKPGQAQTFICEDDGSEFVIMRKDQFDRIAGLAGVGLQPIDVDQTSDGREAQ